MAEEVIRTGIVYVRPKGHGELPEPIPYRYTITINRRLLTALASKALLNKTGKASAGGAVTAYNVAPSPGVDMAFEWKVDEARVLELARQAARNKRGFAQCGSGILIATAQPLAE